MMKSMRTSRSLFVLGATFVCGLLLQAAATNAQQPVADPAAGLFGLDRLHTIHLKVPTKSWELMEPNPISPRRDPLPADRPGGPGRFGPQGPGGMGGPGDRRGPRGPGPIQIDFESAPATFEIDGQVLEQVGLRFKGNSSFRMARHALKRSFKVDFNDYVKGQKLFGLTKLNLNNNAMDASQMAEALGYAVFRDAGLPTPRTAFARVYLTVPDLHEGRYLGLYTLVEQVDDRFLERCFGTKKGLLLKPDHPRLLPYLGPDWSVYEDVYDPQDRVTPEEAERVIGLARLAQDAPDEEFRAKLPEWMDVEQFLRFTAVNVAIGNCDSPLMIGHNFYLWRNPEGGRMLWIPWDLNHAFGGFPGAGPPKAQAELSLQRPYTRDAGFLDRVLTVPEWQQSYRRHLTKLMETAFRLDVLQARTDQMAMLLRPAVREEDGPALDRFEVGAGAVDAAADPSGRGEVGPRRQPIALKPWIAARIESMRAQLAGKSEGRPPEREGPLRPRGDAARPGALP